MSKKYIVNEDGEILEEIDGYKLLKGSSLRYLTETTSVKIPFVKFNPKVLEELENIEETVKLLSYIEYKSNVLCYKNGKLIKNMKSLGKIFSKNKDVGYRKVRKLLEEDVIRKYKDESGTSFVFNPYIAHRGKRINKVSVNLFKSSKWKRDFNEDY